MAQTLSAGLDANQALSALVGTAKGVFDDDLARAQKLIRGGTTLLRALSHIGLVSARDRPLLATAQDYGAFDFACAQLASRYQGAHARWRQIKGRLLMPALMLALTVILLPLPVLVAGKLLALDYALMVIAMLALFASLAKFVQSLVSHWRTDGTPGWLTQIARALPGLGKMSTLHQRADVSERIALALRCGSPAQDIIKMMITCEQNSVYKASLANTRRRLHKDGNVASALQHSELIDAAGFAIVSSGEDAGRLDESLKRVSDQYFNELDANYELIAQWFPVLVYSLVAAAIIAGLLG